MCALDPITELVETYVVKEQKELALLRYEKGLGESADEKGGFLTSWLPKAFVWRAYVERIVQVGAIFVANQKCALSLFF